MVMARQIAGSQIYRQLGSSASGVPVRYLSDNPTDLLWNPCAAVHFESNIPSTMKVLSYIAISLAGLLSGAVVGAVGGFLTGCLLAFGYHNHNHGPGDAPVYVALGLMLVGAGLGAIAGLVVGIIYGVRLTRRANA
jgi:membrane associated rhomboid family serine protease